MQKINLMNITLEELLLSRDNRQQTQMKLLQEYKDKTLLCLTVIMPGKEKRNENSLFVAKCAMESIEGNFTTSILYSEKKDLLTGFEAYYIIDREPFELKKATCLIEEEHPLGRLFDIDIISQEGQPITRQEVGFPPRRCLICEKESRFCMRNFTHSQEELKNKINEMIVNYKA